MALILVYLFASLALAFAPLALSLEYVKRILLFFFVGNSGHSFVTTWGRYCRQHVGPSLVQHNTAGVTVELQVSDSLPFLA